jgi:hypothetical protein
MTMDYRGPIFLIIFVFYVFPFAVPRSSVVLLSTL